MSLSDFDELLIYRFLDKKILVLFDTRVCTFRDEIVGKMSIIFFRSECVVYEWWKKCFKQKLYEVSKVFYNNEKVLNNFNKTFKTKFDIFEACAVNIIITITCGAALLEPHLKLNFFYTKECSLPKNANGHTHKNKYMSHFYIEKNILKAHQSLKWRLAYVFLRAKITQLLIFKLLTFEL